MGIDNLQSGIVGTTLNNQSSLSTTGIALGAGIAGLAVGALGATAISSIVRRRKSRRKRKSYRRDYKTSRSRKKIKHRTSARGKLHYHKGKHRGGKAIHYTKNGQPYRILANGQARFIKK